jgi:hypothetical protein
MSGTIINHNWLQDFFGIVFRVDIQGRGITVHQNLVWNVSVECKLQGYQLAAYNNTVLTHDVSGGFIVVFEPDASAEELAGWRIRNNIAIWFFDRLSLRNDPQKSKREFVIPLATVEGSIDHNVIGQAENHSQLFVDLSGHNFRPKPNGPLDRTGVVMEEIISLVEGGKSAIVALEPEVNPWHAGANWMNDGLKVPPSPAEATELAKRVRPGLIPLLKYDRHYDEQW